MDELFFIRRIIKRDGTRWRQLYNKEPMKIEEELEKSFVEAVDEEPPPKIRKSLYKPLTCNRCGAKWTPRRKEPPVQCPKCKSPYWNREKKKK